MPTSRARAVVPGAARGAAIVLDEPLSFWGGVDPTTGAIVDVHHPQAGTILAGCILVMAGGRGSSSSSSVLAEAVRAGTAPAGFVLKSADPILVIGAVVARELYGVEIPVVVAGDDFYTGIRPGVEVAIEANDDYATIRLD